MTALDVYLGNPDSRWGMRILPAPDGGVGSPWSDSAVAHTLASGGTTVTRRSLTKRVFSLSWPAATAGEAQQILGFVTRAWGTGPFCLVDPSWPNMLPQNVSLSGVLAAVLWSVPAGQTIVYDATLAASQTPSEVLRWAGAGNTSVLALGTQGAGQGEPNITYAAPVIAGMPVTVSAYMATASGTASVNLRASGRNTAGAVHVDASSSTATLTTTYQRVTVTAAAGSLTNATWVIPTVVCNTASAPNILITAPQLEYTSAATAWMPGAGVPRVLPVAPGGHNLVIIGWHETSLTLAEI